MPLTTAILLAAVVTTAYTMLGGMWSVAYTDIVQLGARRDRASPSRCRSCSTAPAACTRVGDLRGGAARRRRHRAAVAAARPTCGPRRRSIGWWDTSLMLVLRRHPVELLLPARAVVPHAAGRARQSMLAGVLTIAFTVPPLLMGIARVRAIPGRPTSQRASAGDAGRHDAAAVRARGAAGDRAARPGGDHRRGDVELQLVDPVGRIDVELELREAPRSGRRCSVAQMRRVIRASILLFGAVATVLALKVQSVQALWFFTSDLVFVLLFPQLLYALFDPQANRTGSIVAFAVSLVAARRRRRAAARPAGAVRLSRDAAVQDGRRRRRDSCCCRSSRAPTARWDPPRPLRNPSGAGA